MTKWIRTVETNCQDQSRDAEFNDWYNNVHIPDMLKLTEVVAVTRYERKDLKLGEAKYLTIYEIETDDIGQTMNTWDALVQSLTKKGRMSNLVDLVSKSVLKQI